MDANNEKSPEPSQSSSMAGLLHVSPPAVSLYFELATKEMSFPKKEIQENYGLTEKKMELYLKELQASGLVRRNPDDTYEAVAPVEAIMIVLTRVRSLLRQIRQEFPEKMSNGIPGISESLQKRVEALPYEMERIRSNIDLTMETALDEFRGKILTLQGASSFETFADDLQKNLLDEVDERMMETRNQLNEFESIDALVNVLNKLKNDVFDIVNISLSDMREQTFRLHELDDFRGILAELWNITPSIVEGHLADFEQEMSVLEASLGDLMETKYRLGAFKGVIENFANEHIMTAVKLLKTNFQLSLTEAIQDHLQQAQERFEEVSVAAHREFDKLREQLAEWVQNALDLAFGEVIQRNQKVATDSASRLEELTRVFRDQFAVGLNKTILNVKRQARELDTQLIKVPQLLTQLKNQEITPHVEQVLTQSEKELEKIAHGVPKAFSEWRTNYIQTADKQVTSLLEEAEGHMTVATQSINQFWRRSIESEPTTFDLYRFVVGEKDFQSQVSSQLARARNHLFLILPRATRVKIKLLRMIPSDVRVRIVVADTPDVKSVQSIQRVAKKNANFQVRHDPRGDLWGVVRDFEEIILGNVSKGKTNVVGIASSHEDHVELLRSIMETRWLHARSLSS
jgi:predicted transcriptional regulator